MTSRDLAALTVPDALGLLAGYGPALAAVMTTCAFDGTAGLWQLCRRLIHWRVQLQWYAIALLLPAAISLSALGLHLLVSREAALSSPAEPFRVASDEPLWQRTFFLALMFTLGFDGLGVELGWRGFALPRLLERFSALAASLIVGALWAAWHLPYALTQGSAMSGMPLLWYLPGMFAAAILSTWIFNNTQGSVLLAILFHAANNTTYHVLPELVPAVRDTGALGTIVQWIVVIAVVAVAGPRHLAWKPPLSNAVERDKN